MTQFYLVIVYSTILSYSSLIILISSERLLISFIDCVFNNATYYFISIEYSFLKGYYVFTIYKSLHSRSSSSSLASFITFVQKLTICPFVKVARISLIVLIPSFEQSLIISPSECLQISLFITWNIISIGASWG